MAIPKIPHHITQRGNNRQPVFDSGSDCAVFLNLMGRYASRYGVAILGYCLMPNHFHLVAVPEEADSMAKTIGRLEADYARYVNVRRNAGGHLWQARFFSVPMDSQYCVKALAYVERNPVRAGIVERAEEYGWSSAAARLGLSEVPEWLRLESWRREWTVEEWRRVLNYGVEERTFGKELRDASMGGNPLGARLIARLEWTLGRPLRPGKAGRPRKWAGIPAMPGAQIRSTEHVLQTGG